MFRKTNSIFISLLGAMLMVVGAASAGERSVQTTADVYQWWDPGGDPVGTASLTRTSAGITAVLNTSELPAGSAVTLWIVVFNHPENCADELCAMIPDLFNPAVGADFHFGGGHVVGESGRTTFAGHLSVGDTSGSGLAETGLGLAVPLTEPFDAQVILAVHVHGPQQKGKKLKDQISSYLGGCDVFVGPDGFAAGPGDVPDEIGECSTTQMSRP